MAATKTLADVTLELSVENGTDAKGVTKYKNIDYKALDPAITPDQLQQMGDGLGGLMEKAPSAIYSVERHRLAKED